MKCELHLIVLIKIYLKQIYPAFLIKTIDYALFTTYNVTPQQSQSDRSIKWWLFFIFFEKVFVMERSTKWYVGIQHQPGN